MRGLFVTATDTGVGKTVVTAALALALRARGIDAGVAKPLQSGHRVDDPDGDAGFLARALELADPPEALCAQAFAAPLAPLVAARREGRAPELEPLVEWLEGRAERHELLLVEGAGGLLVPAGEDWTVADLASRLGLPVVVVARPGLGTVNHTLLTLEALRSRSLVPLAVVLNGLRRDTDESWRANPELIAGFGRVPVAGTIPWIEDRSPSALAEAAAAHLDLDLVLDALTGKETGRA